MFSSLLLGCDHLGPFCEVLVLNPTTNAVAVHVTMQHRIGKLWVILACLYLPYRHVVWNADGAYRCTLWRLLVCVVLCNANGVAVTAALVLVDKAASWTLSDILRRHYPFLHRHHLRRAQVTVGCPWLCECLCPTTLRADVVSRTHRVDTITYALLLFVLPRLLSSHKVV